MFKRFVLVVGGLLMILAIIGGIKFKQIQQGMARLENYAPPPATISVVEARSESWRPQVASVGTLNAIEGIELAAEVSGTVDGILFQSGQQVAAGQLLITLNDDVEQANLLSYQAQAELAAIKFKRSEGLFRNNNISETDYDQASADLKVANANVAQTRATIAKKNIRAPFTGVLGIRKFSMGEYIKNGDALVTLQDTRSLYADFSVPEQYLPQLYTGQEVVFRVSAAPDKEFRGQVIAVEAKVDEKTRNIAIRAKVPNESGELHPGMYADIRLLMRDTLTPIVVPSTAVAYSPFGDAVFVVENNDEGQQVARRIYVQVGEQRGDWVSILSGLEAGMQVVNAGTSKLENGTAVTISNAVEL
ncbi:efflux RND transporter periplasmic adaptor subunit [Ferrimonas sediminicola]|uniref:Efflux RND transporter periplasmic adaptor subunit n=1 Tax=Ferrimonas sediminicola TaxID=2569538 RepID=A0A4U1BHZ4_9GAMM|nr:efflux RND transporter periplasmic adaptor subunit [Ferrimonas sediminicola]TKB51040.1 efflux RND transporter periplasmic adaptor subunit [Ferrimonas sediminicola]